MRRALKVALLAKEDGRAGSLALRLAEEFRRRGVDVVLDDVTSRRLKLPGGYSRRKIPADRGLVISIGGDGTLLSAARAASPRSEVFGVNTGTLGFLTSTSRRDVRGLVDDAMAGRFRRDIRRPLEISVGNSKSSKRFLVLNDAVLSRGPLSRIARFTLSFDGKPFSSMRADGLIISTPTGSTAYNLSAGGPLLHPSVRAYLVTPICPHALTHRPFVLPDDKTLEVTAEPGSPEGIYLTLDGQEGFPLPAGCRVRASVSRRTITLLRPSKDDYFATLSEKLNWGA